MTSDPTASVSKPNVRVYPRWDAAFLEAIRAARPRRIFLQVPAGLVRHAEALADELRTATSAHVSLSARACFGACDLPTATEAGAADLNVVLGHAPIPNVPVERPTWFVEMRDDRGDPVALAGALERAGVPRRIGLVYSVQHLDLRGPLEAELGRRGFSVRVAAGDRRLAYPGQALGCNYTGAEAVADQVDAFVFAGTARFHPVGLAFATERPVYAVDPMGQTVEPPIDRSALVRRRQLLVASLASARRWGIVVSTFVGQERLAMARSLEERARRRGREATIVRTDRLEPADLEGRGFDAYVSTACPRIALDDSSLYPRPILTPPEFLTAIGDRPIEPYVFDTFH